MNEGKVVIVDRYYYSTIAYQGSRLDDVTAITNKVLEKNFLKPDLAIVFDLPVEVALHRIRNTRGDIPNEFEKAEPLEVIKKIFLKLSETQPEIKKIDSSKSIDVLQQDILQLFFGVLKAKHCLKDYASDCATCGFKMSKSCKYFILAGMVKK